MGRGRGFEMGREVAGLDSGGLVGWYTQWVRAVFAGVVRMPNGHLLCNVGMRAAGFLWLEVVGSSESEPGRPYKIYESLLGTPYLAKPVNRRLVT